MLQMFFKMADRQLAPGELAETRPGILPPTRPAPVRILMHKKFFSEILTQKT